MRLEAEDGARTSRMLGQGDIGQPGLQPRSDGDDAQGIHLCELVELQLKNVALPPGSEADGLRPDQGQFGHLALLRRDLQTHWLAPALFRAVLLLAVGKKIDHDQALLQDLEAGRHARPQNEVNDVAILAQACRFQIAQKPPGCRVQVNIERAGKTQR